MFMLIENEIKFGKNIYIYCLNNCFSLLYCKICFKEDILINFFCVELSALQMFTSNNQMLTCKKYDLVDCESNTSNCETNHLVLQQTKIHKAKIKQHSMT